MKKTKILISDYDNTFYQDEKDIKINIAKVKEYGSCITCVPAIETVIVDKHDGSLFIPKRSDCMMARAPQSFYLKDMQG